MTKILVTGGTGYIGSHTVVELLEEEMEVVRSHSQKGVEILSPVKYYHSSIPGILHHHEWYDGSGYPAGLAGKEIPLWINCVPR